MRNAVGLHLDAVAYLQEVWVLLHQAITPSDGLHSLCRARLTISGRCHTMATRGAEQSPSPKEGRSTVLQASHGGAHGGMSSAPSTDGMGLFVTGMPPRARLAYLLLLSPPASSKRLPSSIMIAYRCPGAGTHSGCLHETLIAVVDASGNSRNDASRHCCTPCPTYCCLCAV